MFAGLRVAMFLLAFSAAQMPSPEASLSRAEEQFDSARQSYEAGKTAAGDDALNAMSKDLDQTVSSLATAHKSRLYKRAELRVALLQRRMQSLLDEINIEQRGWAEQTSRHLAEVHDKLLEGALRK